MIRPLRDLLLLRFLEPDVQAGAIYLPDVAREDGTRDGLITAIGPDCQQARVGDRCVSLKHSIRTWIEPEPPRVVVDGEIYTDYVFLWEWAKSRGWKGTRTRHGMIIGYVSPAGTLYESTAVYEHELWLNEEVEAAILQQWSRSRFALVAESDLVALIPGPTHSELRAANDYVLIQPDRHRQYEERPSGVVVAGHSLPGFRGRSLKRGKELLDQASAMVRSKRFREAVEYDQWRMRRDWEDALSPTDRAAWLDACRDQGEAGGQAWAFTPCVSKAAPVTGTVVDVAPGIAPFRAGDRVSYEKQHRGAEVYSDGRALIALRADDVAAVIVEDLVAELAAA